jgi:hypothetical protein
MTTFHHRLVKPLRTLLTLAVAAPAVLAVVVLAGPAAPAAAAIDLDNCEGDLVDRCVGVRYDRGNRRYRPYLRATDLSSVGYWVDATHLRFGYNGVWWGYGLPDGAKWPTDQADGPLRDCPADGSAITLTVYGEFRWRQFSDPAASGGDHHWLFRVCN